MPDNETASVICHPAAGTSAATSGPVSGVGRPASSSSPASDSDSWMPIWRIAVALGCTHRHARRELAGTDPGLIRYTPQARGAPIKLYHVSAHPALARRQEAGCRSQESEAGVRHPASGVRSSGAAPEDLALAELRAEAVRLYIELRGRLPEAEAARQVCATYQAHPKSRHIYIGERLAENNLRKHDQSVTLAGFSPGTLRHWHRAWSGSGPASGVGSGNAGASGLMALIPERKGKSGRKRGHGGKDIPETLLNIVWAWSIKNPRADLRKGIAAARKEYPGDFPEFSYSTWLRRLTERDPEHFTATLGKYGVAAFRQKCSPDIQRDYSNMGYNELWELDDATMDFYGLNWRHERFIRPFAYAINRVATRQWVAVVTTETPIVKDQVKPLLGLAMANPAGGIPAEIRFERGTVACDASLEELLTTIGVKVHRTSMDGGKRHAGAFEDRATGHAAGKGVIERAIRSLHNQPGNWDHPLQVGIMERTDSPANLETIKAALLAEAKAGRVQIRFTPAQWQAGVAAAMEIYNDTPHSALPEIVDPETSTSESLKYRHMSPNEYAANMKITEIKTLSENLLPLFFHRGNLVPVGKNGFTLNNFGYGRFDPGVQEFAGQKVTAFQLPECPRVAYVHELGRCVEAWRMPKAGQEGNLIEVKRGIEAGKRNKYEALMAEVLASGSQAVIDQTRILSNPVRSGPSSGVRRPASVICRPISDSALVARAARMEAGIKDFTARQRTRDARFDLSAMPSNQPKRTDRTDRTDLSSAPAVRRGILARGEEMDAELAVLNDSTQNRKEAEQNF